MTSLGDANGEELYRRFIAGGFERLVNEQPRELADYLENRAVTSDSSAPLFLALAIRSVYRMFREHDDHGGVQVDFVRWLDHLVKDSLPDIEKSDPIRAAMLAQKFYHEISARVRGYDPGREYSL